MIISTAEKMFRWKGKFMKLCTSTGYLVDKYGIENGLKYLADAGFDGVDYGFDVLFNWGMITKKEPTILDDEQKSLEYARELKVILDKLGLKAYQTHAPYPSSRGDFTDEENARILNTIKNSFRMSEVVGSKKLVVHPYSWGNITNYPTKKEIHDKNIKMYMSLLDVIKETGVTCCLENMFMGDPSSKKLYASCCSSVEEACGLVDELNELAGGEYFGFCLDIGHLVICGLDPYNFTLALGDRIKCFHVHDNNGNEDSHLCPYLGIYHWDRFAQAVREIGYKDPLDLEAGGTYINCFNEDGMTAAATELLHAAGRQIIKMIEEPDKDED